LGVVGTEEEPLKGQSSRFFLSQGEDDLFFIDFNINHYPATFIHSQDT
jgi:hypothetical protein